MATHPLWALVILGELTQNQNSSPSGLLQTHSFSLRCLKSQQYNKKGETQWGCFSHEVAHRANSRCDCHWIKTVNPWNECDVIAGCGRCLLLWIRRVQPSRKAPENASILLGAQTRLAWTESSSPSRIVKAAWSKHQWNLIFRPVVISC